MAYSGFKVMGERFLNNLYVAAGKLLYDWGLEFAF